MTFSSDDVTSQFLLCAFRPKSLTDADVRGASVLAVKLPNNHIRKKSQAVFLSDLTFLRQSAMLRAQFVPNRFFDNVCIFSENDLVG